jgi:hypothetical protein
MGSGLTGSTPANRIACDTGAVNINGILNLDCGNAKITTAGNMNIGIVNSTADGPYLIMKENHTYITGNDSTTNTRDFYIGTPNSGNKALHIVNEKQGRILLTSGTDGSIFTGRNKIRTYSTGIEYYRGGNLGNPDYYGGEIG